MNILIAPDSFKECLSAPEAARAMARGVRRALRSAKIRCVPVADGGEGTAVLLTRALKGRFHLASVRGPLGLPVRARWGYVPRTRAAFLEMAEASGLALVPPRLRNPLKTSTYGTGQLIRAALDRGCRSIVLGIGGSATVDGGLGLAQALGARFHEKRRGVLREIPQGAAGRHLAWLARMDLSGLDPRLKKVRIRVACDVTNPLCGPRGAARVYGPQKGASPAHIRLLDAGLRRFARLAKKQLGRDVARFPGAGAAGGLGAGLAAFLKARPESGTALVFSYLRMEEKVKRADLILTGEGRTDASSAEGKAPAGLAALARRHKKPLVVLAGRVGAGSEKLLERGASAVIPVSEPGLSRARAFREAPRLLARTAERILRRLSAAGGRGIIR